MFNKIILATDGSKDALKAASVCKELLDKNPEATLLVVHARSHLPGVTGIEIGQSTMDDPRIDTAQYGTLDVTMVNEYLTSVAKSTIGSTTKLFESYEDRVSSAIETGDPAPVIADKAKEIEADLVVVGSRGHTGIGSLLMGSVSTKIVQIASCSVMVVR